VLVSELNNSIYNNNKNMYRQYKYTVYLISGDCKICILDHIRPLFSEHISCIMKVKQHCTEKNYCKASSQRTVLVLNWSPKSYQHSGSAFQALFCINDPSYSLRVLPQPWNRSHWMTGVWCSHSCNS
jgi:hypothetical protein